ncbi:hypothetical protein FRC06_010672, partial [Ceratobasidium sp. 370]
SIVVQGLEQVDQQKDCQRERFAEDGTRVGKGKAKVRAGNVLESKPGAEHERAFQRSVSGRALPISNLGSWGLRASMDPRVVEGKIVNHGIVVVGVDAPISSGAAFD